MTLPTLSPIITDLCNHLWQSTLFIAAVALLALALLRYPARARYWLWLTASGKFLIPFSLLIAIGTHIPLPRHATQPLTTYIAIDEISQPFTEFTHLQPAPLLPTPQLRPTHKTPTLPTLLAALWLTGLLTVLTSWLIQWRRITNTLRTATPLHTGRELQALRHLEQHTGASYPIQILASPTSLEPGVFGILRPVLLWPTGLSPHLDDAHLEAVLAHELCHIRRRDNLTSALHMLVEAIFWFHPLVWWIESRLVVERERACDEDVVRLCNQPQVYAESILKVCELCIESPLTCVSGITGADLKKRIVQIMRDTVTRKLTFAAKSLLVASALAAIAAPILLGQAKAAQQLSALILQPLPFLQPSTPQTTPQTPIANSTPPNTETPDTTTGPAFEVATIRPATREGRQSYGLDVTPSGRFTVSALSLKDLVGISYGGLHDTQSGGPKWIDSEFFDITAKVDDADTAGWDKLSQMQRIERVRPLLRTLLAQRFHLKLRTEMRDTPVYALVQAKGGAKLTPTNLHKAIADQQEENHGSSDRVPGKAQPGDYTFNPAENAWTGNAASMDIVASVIANTGVGIMVVDQTGLKGNYDFTLKISRDKDGPTIPQQVEDQLGLKLEPRKLPMKTHVIELADKPSLDGAELPEPMPATLLSAALNREKSTPQAAKPLEFEVATIKPSKADATSTSGIATRYGRIDAENVTLKRCIIGAYGVGPNQITGGPDWVQSERFDIAAKADQPVNDDAVLMQMLQSLMADRFKLKFHRETRTVSAYVLELAQNGPKLEKADPGESTTNTNSSNTTVTIDAHITDMDSFANQLSRKMDRPVVNRTGLDGKFNLKLHWTPDSAKPGSHGAGDDVSIFDAIQEQLGLRLRAAKEPVETIVIDHVEMPSPN